MRFRLFGLSLLIVVAAGCQEGSKSANSPVAGGRSQAGDGGGKSSDGTRKYRIAVIPKGTTHEFWKSVHAGAANAAKELGDVDILWIRRFR